MCHVLLEEPAKNPGVAREISIYLSLSIQHMVVTLSHNTHFSQGDSESGKKQAHTQAHEFKNELGRFKLEHFFT